MGQNVPRLPRPARQLRPLSLASQMVTCTDSCRALLLRAVTGGAFATLGAAAPPALFEADSAEQG